LSQLPSKSIGSRLGLGRLRALSPRKKRMFFLLAVAEFFDNYDIALSSIALLQIQEGLGIAEESVGYVSGLIRLGMATSFLVTILADRFGRRRMLLFSVLGFSFFTFATAFARDPTEFVIAQFFARAFIGAEIMLASVVIVEELEAKDRGWGIGVLGALGALGHGAAAIVFAGIDVLPYGWRALYALGAIPLLWLAWLRRNLQETERFEQMKAERDASGQRDSPLKPLFDLFGNYPGRLAVVAVSVFSFDILHWTAFGFMSKTLQQVHGYAHYEVTVLMLIGGALGIMGNIVAGVLGDRWGRRNLLSGIVLVYGFAVYFFYNASGLAVVPAWIAMVFGATGTGVLWKAIGNEIFPTSYRSTAAGVRLAIATLGGATGLMLESQLYPTAQAGLGDVAVFYGHGVAITWMIPVLIIPAIAVFFLPESAGRELEDIAPERGAT